MNNNMTFGLGQTLQGFYKVASVDARTEEIQWESDWNKNLILNQGMDEIPYQYICNSFTYALAGTGSRPNKIASGTSTITQSGATIRLAPVAGLMNFTSSVVSASQFQYAASAQVGDMIQDSDLSESRITAVNADGINLTVTPSYTYSNEKTFTIYKTSQRGLHGEVKRYNSYLQGVGNCGTTNVNLTVYNMRRTYDFTSESILRTYTEIGTAWASLQTGSNVFSRILLPTPIDIGVGFKLRVVYELQSTISPASPVYFTASISGWPHPLGSASATIATQSIQMPLMSTVNTTGGTLYNLATGVGYYTLEPFAQSGNQPGQFNMFASSNSESLSSIGTASLRDTNVATVASMTTASYITGSYYLDKISMFAEGVLNISNIRSIGVGGFDSSGGGSDVPWSTTRQAFCIVFNEPQMKESTQQLSITLRSGWGRTLS